MFKRFTSIKPAMLLLSFALIAGLGFTASAQKHGNKNGNGHGNGGEKQGGGEARDRDNENGRREGQRRVERQQTSQAVFGNPESDRGDRGNKHGNRKQKHVDDRQTFPVYPPQIIYGGGWVPPGQIRNREVHERNDARKEWKDQEKAYKRLYKNKDRDDQREQNRAQYGIPQWWGDPNVDRRLRSYSPHPRETANDVHYDPYNPNVIRRSDNPNYSGYDQYSYDNGYESDRYDNGGSNWKSSLLRTLISSVLSGFGGGNDSYYEPNDYRQNYSGIPVNYAQTPYYGNDAPQYAAYGSGYSPYRRSDPNGDQSNYGGLLGALPIAELFGGGSDFGGILSGGLSQVLAQGYLQGLSSGETARRNNYGDRYYNDPYVTDAGIYDQGSSTIAGNRRLLSEGYALGYQDALNGRGQLDNGSGRGLDLVSVLLSDLFKLG